MNNTNKIDFRHVWWGLLLVATSIYFFKFFDRISSSPTTIDGTITLSLLLLLFMPLVKEISAFGMSIKKEVREVKDDMQREVSSIKNEIFTLAMSNNQRQEMHFYSKAPTEDEVDSRLNVKKDIVEVPEKELKVAEEVTEYNTQNNKKLHEANPTQVFLFKTRFSLENLILDLCNKHGLQATHSIKMNIVLLRKNNLLSTNAEKMIYDVSSICNRGIHGEVVDSKYVDYVRVVMEDIIAEFDKVVPKEPNKTKMNCFTSCSKCGYTGASYYNNQCPKCGFVTDEY